MGGAVKLGYQVSNKISYHKLVWLGVFVLFLAAVVMGIFAWREASQAYVIIEWETASELNTAGFFLNRGETLEGPFERVNHQIIAASPDPITGGSYRYKDLNVQPSVTYYYMLQEVELDGNFSSYGPIEITANAGGRQELILAVLLLLAGGIGLISVTRREKVTNDQS